MATLEEEVKALKATNADLKAKVSELDNARNKLSMDLGAALKDTQAHQDLKAEHSALKGDLDRANARIGNLEADLNNATSRAGRDSELVAAARQVEAALKRYK